VHGLWCLYEPSVRVKTGYTPACLHLRIDVPSAQSALLSDLVRLARADVSQRPTLLLEGRRYVLDGMRCLGTEVVLDFKLLEA
jgi:hypothetical protein